MARMRRTTRRDKRTATLRRARDYPRLLCALSHRRPVTR